MQDLVTRSLFLGGQDLGLGLQMGMALSAFLCVPVERVLDGLRALQPPSQLHPSLRGAVGTARATRKKWAAQG